MCGICGFVGDGSEVRQNAMSAALSHRGPDDDGVYHQQLSKGRSVFLANRRLAILDLSPTGHQPMTTADGRFTIAFNGEIYNFREIGARLRSAGVRFSGGSDTEVVLYAWREWGPECLSSFRGMFAFAIYDSREERLFLVRDRLGEKPVYYWKDRAVLLFSSEVRSLLASGVVPRKMDSDGLDAFLTFGSSADPFTLVDGIRSLEAGHVAEFADGKLVIRPYWNLSQIPETDLSTVDPGESTEEVGRLLRNSLRLSMESDVPVGILLSGGVDSSSNVVLLSELGFDNLSTFSVVFPGEEASVGEKRWARFIADQFGMKHEVHEIGAQEAKSLIAEGVSKMDQPSIDGINTFIVMKAIADAGIKVAVSGQGGDELFLGYSQRKAFPLLAKLAALHKPWPIPRLARAASNFRGIADSRFEKGLQLLKYDDAPLHSAYLANHTIYAQAGLERLRAQPRPPQGRFIRSQGSPSTLGELSRLELAFYLRNTLLRDADQMSMANSVELRQPMLDVRLVEAVVSLPIDFKIQKGRQKPLLVDAVGPKLPKGIHERAKTGFRLPYDRWLREGLMLCDPLEIATGLDAGEVKAVQGRFEAGKYWTRFWALQVLAAWVDRNGIRPPE